MTAFASSLFSFSSVIAIRKSANSHVRITYFSVWGRRLEEARSTEQFPFGLFLLFLGWLGQFTWQLDRLVVVQVGDHETLLICKIQVDVGALDHKVVENLRDVLVVASTGERLHLGLLLLVAEGEDQDEVLTEQPHFSIQFISFNF